MSFSLAVVISEAIAAARWPPVSKR
jgi:hypothetical protein